MRNHRAIAVAAVLLVTVSISMPLAAEGDAGPDPREIRVFRLSHLDTKTAVTMFRTLLQTRVVAEVPAQRAVILRDTPDLLARAEQLMGDLDAAQPRWMAELVVDVGKREQTIREIDLADLEAGVSYTRGESGKRRVSLDLRCDPGGNGTIAAEYEIAVNLYGSKEQGFRERGSSRLAAGDSLVIFRPGTQDLRGSLALVLGLDGEVDALRLRFKQRP